MKQLKISWLFGCLWAGLVATGATAAEQGAAGDPKAKPSVKQSTTHAPSGAAKSSASSNPRAGSSHPNTTQSMPSRQSAGQTGLRMPNSSSQGSGSASTGRAPSSGPQHGASGAIRGAQQGRDVRSAVEAGKMGQMGQMRQGIAGTELDGSGSARQPGQQRSGNRSGIGGQVGTDPNSGVGGFSSESNNNNRNNNRSGRPQNNAGTGANSGGGHVPGLLNPMNGNNDNRANNGGKADGNTGYGRGGAYTGGATSNAGLVPKKEGDRSPNIGGPSYTGAIIPPKKEEEKPKAQEPGKPANDYGGKPNSESTSKPGKDDLGKEPKEPKENVGKNDKSTMPTDDNTGQSGSSQIGVRQLSGGPGARGDNNSGTSPIRATIPLGSLDSNPNVDRSQGSNMPRDTTGINNTPGARPGL